MRRREADKEAGRVRVAMIGAEDMANHVHYPSLALFDDVELAAICDLDEGRLKATADTYGIEKRYADYRKEVKEVAGSDELVVFGGLQAKSWEFIDCVKRGGQPGSHFGDAVKTMEVVERILAQSLMEGS